MKKHTIFVFTNLKPSQINYKIIPLSHSGHVEKVIVLRKKFMEIKQDKVVCMPLPGLMRIRPFYWFFVAVYGIYLIRKLKVTLILSYNIFPHGFNAYFASLFTRKPVIFAEINEDTIAYHQKPIVRPLILRILNNARYILVPGSKTGSYWKAGGFNKMVILHSTINTDVFKPNASIAKEFDFLYIGVYDSNKRPDMILDAFAALREEGIQARICMIGFGPLGEVLLEKAKSLRIEDRVVFHNTGDVIDYINKSRIFVMASLSEGIPCAMMESMACEVIPIVPDVGDIKDVVKFNENGILYDGSYSELKRWMKDILTRYPQLDDMKKRARKTIVEGHSYAVATSRWDNLLGQIN
jgi:glycosyltransferase involved in cell wall biosynthesis